MFGFAPEGRMVGWLSGAIALFFTVLSGVLDARGFVYAARAWPDGHLDLKWGSASVLAFVGGLSCYVIAVRFMQGFGVTSVVLQSGLWLLVTGIGVAVMDGSILSWTRLQQAVAVLVAIGLAYLVMTTAAQEAGA